MQTIDSLKKAKPEFVALFIITALGAILRFWGFWTLSLWADEGQVFITAENILQTGLPLLDSGYLYSRDLLHLYLTAGSMAVFGHNEFAVRLPSVLAGTGLILAIYLFVRTISTSRAGVVAASITAFHPWYISYSQFARSYIIAVFFITVTLYYFSDSYINNNYSKERVIVLTISGICAVLSHQTGQVVILYAFLTILLSDAVKNISSLSSFKTSSHKQIDWSQIYYVIPICGIGIAIVLSKLVASKSYWQYTTAIQSQATESTSEGVVSILAQIRSFIPFGVEPQIHNILYIFNPIPVILSLSILSIISLSYINQIYDTSDKMRYFLLLCVATFIPVVFAKRDVSTSRAYLFTTPILISAIAIFSEHILKSFESPWAPEQPSDTVLSVILIILLLPFVWQSIGVVTTSYGEDVNKHHSPGEVFSYRQDTSSTYEFVNQHAENDETIVVFGNPKFAPAYLDPKKEVDYWAWTATNYSIEGEHYYIGDAMIISEYSQFQEILENRNQVWIVTTYSISDVGHLNQRFRSFANEKCAVFQSKDPNGKVILYKEGKAVCERSMIDRSS
ncbi:ArnT family glycosyltransferase [Haloarcula amylovorans]|uniref:ArnT family glycosyltransferase n=1 Tax=Haloarcula amylovorans TaxID=2562280 RepID=UPI001075FA8F|nr:glycosyltransferase family 39 protein [Halomicroarcula amylolytica]